MDSGFPWWILLIVVFAGVIVYLLFMIFLPEWVGITGQTALRNERSHREDPNDPLVQLTTKVDAAGEGSKPTSGSGSDSV